MNWDRFREPERAWRGQGQTDGYLQDAMGNASRTALPLILPRAIRSLGGLDSI